MGLCFIARFAIGNRAVGLYVPVFKNRMNALARTADTVTDAAGHSGMKNDNFKDGEMRLTVGLALTLAIMTCGAPASCRAMTWTWPAISGARSDSR